MPSLRDRLRTLTTALLGPAGGPRVAGPPRSSNGASSFHLAWEMPRAQRAGQGRGRGAGREPAARLVEVSVVLEVLIPPRVSALYFWALQVDFLDDGLLWGGGHTGLQWNRRFSQGTAANWGGYATQERGGAILAGSSPLLPAFSGDPNTMAYEWRSGRPYRLRVHRSPDAPGAWRAEVTDMTTGRATVLRDLLRAGERPGGGLLRGAAGAVEHKAYLRNPIVWSEVFADCDAPSVVVRWSDLKGEAEDGELVYPDAVRVNYQSAHDGGCANTTVRRDEKGILQITNAPREVEQGTRLSLGAGDPVED